MIDNSELALVQRFGGTEHFTVLLLLLFLSVQVVLAHVLCWLAGRRSHEGSMRL